VRFADGHFYVEAPDGKNLTNHPVTAASWFGAAAYCNWLSERRGLQQVYDWAHWETQRKSPLPNGYRLPTEAEWERAACWSAALNQYTLPDSSTGGRYPYAFMSTQLPLGDWGNNWCNYNYANPMSLPFEPYTTPVGYYTAAASSAGCFDMNGNAWEWCHDFFDTQTGAQPDTNPIGPGPSQLWGGIKVLRGMSYTSGGCPMSAFVRTGFSQGGDHTIGFRLARLGGDPR
jgi:formylglycine-generating enzyme required for sulfatase activity